MNPGDTTPPTTARGTRWRRRLHLASIVVFLAAILAPTVDTFLRTDEVRGPGPEMRSAAKRPHWRGTQTAMSTWPAAYEAYFVDTCGLRDVLMRLNSLAKYYVFGVSPSPVQVVGRHGWIFYAGDRSMEVHRGTFPFEPGDLERWAGELENRRRSLEAVGCRYLFVIVPNKETIYPEFVDPSITRIAPTRFDVFHEYVRTHTSVDLLDLRPAMAEAKKNDTGPMDVLYTPHGTHWTARGTQVAYQQLVRRVAQIFPGTTYVPPEEFDVAPTPYGTDTFAVNLYLEGILRQPGTLLYHRGGPTHWVKERRDAPPRWRRTQAEGENRLPHTLLFHDSFGPFVYDQLADSFSILDTHEGEYETRSVEAGATKLVIEMWVERYLVNHAPRADRDERVGSLRQMFDLAPHRLFALDAASNNYQPFEGGHLEPVSTPDGPAVTLWRTTVKGGLRTHVFRSPPRGDVLAHVVLDCDRPATLEIMWRETNGPEFNRARRALLPLREGPFETVESLPALGKDCEILLRPTEPDARITLRTFEVRSVEAP